MRIAHAVYELRLDFPWDELTSDPFEQFIVGEAIMDRYVRERNAEYERVAAKEKAMAEAKARLGR